MPPDFPAYTRSELVERGRNLLSTRRRGIDTEYGSDYDIWARMLGWLAWSEQKRAEALLIAQDPRRASGQYLAEYAEELSVGRDVASLTTAALPSTGSVIVLSAGAVQVPAGTLLRHADGTEYALSSPADISASAGKMLCAGLGSSRTRIYQGHFGSGFVNVVPGEVYCSLQTGEFFAVVAADNHSSTLGYLLDILPPLSTDPELLDVFVQMPGGVASVAAVAPGMRGNKEPRDVLTFEGAPASVVPQSEVIWLSGGADAMTTSEVRAAAAALLAQRAPTMTLEDIRQLALAAPLTGGVKLSECYVLPAYNGISTYTLLGVRADGQYLAEGHRHELVAYVSARCSPVDKLDTAPILEFFDTQIKTLSVQVSDLYAPDFSLPDESERGIEITDGTNTELTLAEAPVGIVEGARVIVTSAAGAGAPYSVVRRVVGLSAGNTVLSLDAPLPYPPELSWDKSYVTAGGPLAEAILQAIAEAYRSRAPSLGTDGGVARLRYPPTLLGDSTEAVLRAVSQVEGVIDVSYFGDSPRDEEDLGAVYVPSCTVRMYAPGRSERWV